MIRVVVLVLSSILLASMAHGQAQPFCFLCQTYQLGCKCINSVDSEGYPAGGDCACVTVKDGGDMTTCSATGICSATTTDPNWQTDCPDGLNAKCCSGGYKCAAYCDSYGVDALLGKAPGPVVYANEKFSLTRDDISRIIQASEDKDTIRVNPDEHPWITSKSLVDEISKYSPDMAALIKLKRRRLAEHFMWDARGRNRERGGLPGAEGEREHGHYQIERLGSKWTFLLTDKNVTGVNTMILDGKTWTVSHNETVIANGQIE